MSVMQGAMQLVGSMMRSGLDEAAFQMGGKKPQALRRLGKGEQVSQYMKMSPRDKERVIQERGPEEYKRYEQAMLKLLEGGY